jgi:ABC-2 type transport system permease protein
VLVNLVARDLKVKYQRSVLGFLWTLVYPAFMLGIYIVIFGLVLRIDIENFWAYLIAGLLPFQFLTAAVVEGSHAIRTNSSLIRKIYFPAEVLVIATVTAKLVEFLGQLAVAILFLAIWHHGDAVGVSLGKAMGVLPGAIAALYLLALGLALPLAAWSVIWRDLEHLVALAMTAWFYLTPIFWNVELARRHIGQAAQWFVLNPAMNVIELFRGPLYWGAWPANHAIGGGPGTAWATALLGSCLIFVLGYILFNRSKRILSEVV